MSFAYHMGGLVWITTKQREITNLNIAIRLNAAVAHTLSLCHKRRMRIY